MPSAPPMWCLCQGKQDIPLTVQMFKMSWTPQLLEKVNSKINPVNNIKTYECPQYRKKA